MAFKFGQRRVTDPLAQQNFEQLEGVLSGPEPTPIDEWHTIGDSTTGLGSAYVNGWRAYAGGASIWSSPTGFWKDPFGTVRLQGLVDKNGGSFVANETMFVLPVGYRPAENLIFTVEAAGGNPTVSENTGQVRVYTTGEVQVGTRGGPVNPVQWLSLTEIEFRAADAPTSIEALKGPKGDPGLGWSQYTPGLILDTQHDQGSNTAYAPFGNGTNITTNAAQTDILAVSYTAEVDSWWEVTAHIGICQKLDAAYHYASLNLKLTDAVGLVADENGVSETRSYAVQHSSVDYFIPRATTKLWKLAAGKTYTCRADWETNGGTWQYYQGPIHLWMDGKAWVR